MATRVLKIGEANDDDDEDEISILRTKPAAFYKSGATKADAIPVESYYSLAAKLTIDLTLDDDDDVVRVPTKRRRFYKGETFNSKRDDGDIVEFPAKWRRFYKGETSNSKREDGNVVEVPTKRRRLYKGETSKSKPNDAVFNRSFTCEICNYDKSIRDSFGISGCDHRYCTKCISKYVAARLQQNTAAISCPVPRCGGCLEPHLCHSILPRAVFERWGDALCEAMIVGEEKLYCPYKDCSALLIEDRKAELTESKCPECGRLFCVQCEAPWQQGIDCKAFRRLRKDERSNEDIKLMNLAKRRKWVRYPKCRVYVSRRSGCRMMICRCGESFCYSCGGRLKSGHSCRCMK